MSATEEKEAFRKALAVLRRGGLACLPTETFYGLCADATAPHAISRLFELKNRETDKPVPLLLPNLDQLWLYVTEVTPIARKLIGHYWPGPLNLVFKARQPSQLAVPMLSGTVAFRLSSDPLASALASELGRPLAATSANISGQPASCTVDEIPQQILQGVDIIVNDGSRPGVKGSTIVDVTGTEPRIMREGDLEIHWPD